MGRLAPSAVVMGTAQLAQDAWLAHGVVVRAHDGAVALENGSAVLENSVVVGTPQHPAHVGRRALLGHRCVMVGASVGDLCEIGNGTLLMPGAQLGARCFTGEGTLIPENAVFDDGSVVVGRPGRVIRKANAKDLERLLELRGGSLELPAVKTFTFQWPPAAGKNMGKLYALNGKAPQVDGTAVLLDSAELSGDVQVGASCFIGAGVKIVGDSHGPVRIGKNVQILENTVLHLLPHNELVIEDDVVIGPGAMIHGCHLEHGVVIEPGGHVCDFARVGSGSVVKAGSLVKQRQVVAPNVVVEGFPARVVEGAVPEGKRPAWAVNLRDVHQLVRLR